MFLWICVILVVKLVISKGVALSGNSKYKYCKWLILKTLLEVVMCGWVPVASFKEKYYCLGCQSVYWRGLWGGGGRGGGGVTILTLLVSNSYRVRHLGGVSQRMLNMDNMIGKRIILRELMQLTLSWLGLGTFFPEWWNINGGFGSERCRVSRVYSIH